MLSSAFSCADLLCDHFAYCSSKTAASQPAAAYFSAACAAGAAAALELVWPSFTPFSSAPSSCTISSSASCSCTTSYSASYSCTLHTPYSASVSVLSHFREDGVEVVLSFFLNVQYVVYTVHSA